MADDTDWLLAQLKIEHANFFGWSDGANVAMHVAIRHPNRVGKLVLLEASIENIDALGPEIITWLKTAKPEDFGKDVQEAYAKVAPDPNHWPALVAKWKELQLGFKGVRPELLKAITAPVLVMGGDTQDRPEHAVQMFRLFPNAQLAVLPGTTHFAIMERPEWVLSMLTTFLDAPRK